jgi:sigma-54 dependent transcriptional regulator of gfr operon
MTNREIIIKEVKENNLERINNGIKEFGITAQELFEKTSINRSLISHCLSVLNKEGKIIKINTRPVYFIDLEIFENSFDVELRGELIYKNFEELMEIKEKQFF